MWTCRSARRLGPPPRAKARRARLLEPFREDFTGCEEPDIYEILECARPYLPREGAFGEMVLNVGKVVYLAKKGAAGIIDISPFTCMNGIVCEAIYPEAQPRPGRHSHPQFLFRRHAIGSGPRLRRLHGTGARLSEEEAVDAHLAEVAGRVGQASRPVRLSMPKEGPIRQPPSNRFDCE